MLATLFDGAPALAGDRAGVREGALALVTGLAANRSFATGAAVPVADVLDIPPA
jgi:hypothetical protein